MTSAFSWIVAAFVDRLKQVPEVSPSVERTRDRPLPKNCQTGVVVQWEGSLPDVVAIRGAPINWVSRVTVSCSARAVEQTGDEAVDPLLERVYSRLAADPTLGGLVFDIGLPTLEADTGVEGEKTGWIQMTYHVKHRTQRNNLEKS